MAFVSFCPHLIADYPADNLTECYRRIQVFVKIIEYCQENSLDCTISKIVYKLFSDSFPWQRTSINPKQRALVLQMQKAILPKIERMIRADHALPSSDSIGFDCVYLTDQEMIQAFDGFLSDYFVEVCLNGKTVNALLIEEMCHDLKGHIFYINLNSLEDLSKFKFKWLKVYNTDLPAEGEFPFIPPNGWETLGQKKGIQKGWIDSQGNEWKWDKLHNNHWDVQLASGGYKNVSPDGRIL